MVPKLEAIKGGGGSIKVGSTGTISNLISRELESPKREIQPTLPPIKISTFSESVSIPCQALTPRKPKQKLSTNGEKSCKKSSGTISNLISRKLESPKREIQPTLPPIKISTFSESVSIPCQALTPRKQKPSTNGEKSCKKIPENNGGRVKPHNRRSSRLPMLESDDVLLEGTPRRGKVDRRGGGNIVDIVDIKCGHPDRAWATPITNKLKKLGFSKLSENNIV